MVCLTADANCSSVMSSTKTVLAEGSSGRASADPIISKVIPCLKKINFMKMLKSWSRLCAMKEARHRKTHVACFYLLEKVNLERHKVD